MKKRIFLCLAVMALAAALLVGCSGKMEEPSAEPPLYSIEDLKTNPETKDLFFTDLGTHTKPKNLLAIVFNYQNGYFDMPDEELAQVWSDYIFGTENGDVSVNDYFREVSQGQFWFNPVCIGDDKTGVQVVHLDKDYSDEQLCHEEYPFFDFSYDAAVVMDDLISKGLDITRFKADGIDHENFKEKLIGYFDSRQDMRPSQWFDTDALLFIFPPINMAKVDLTPLSSDFCDYGLYCHLCMDSSLGTIVHELSHTLGAVDVYNYCMVRNDLMSAGYDRYESDETAHINPYYKLLWGWCKTQRMTADGTVKLYPATSPSYSPVLIPTEDPNQYFLIENRQAEGYDSYLSPQEDEPDYTGLTVWRVDKLALEKIYTDRRKGISMEGVLCEIGDRCELLYYAGRDDPENDELINSGITVEFVNETPDYIEMRVSYRK